MAEADCVDVDVVGNARRPLVRSLRVWCAPVVAAIVGFPNSALAAVLLHLPRKIGLAAGDGAVEGFRVV